MDIKTSQINTPAQLIIGCDVYNRLSKKDKQNFILYKKYEFLNEEEWLGDNFFYDNDDLKEFWGVNNLKNVLGSVYIRIYDNFTDKDERKWRELSEKNTQVKIIWC